MAVNGTFIALFVSLVILGICINFLVIPAFDSVKKSVNNVSELSVGRVGTSNTTGNVTAQYSTNAIGLFGDPQTQLLTVLVIIGVAGTVGAIAVFGTGAQPGPAAVAAFVTALAFVIVNTLLAAMPAILSIPVIGTPMFIVSVGIVMVVTLIVAGGIMAGGSAC